jgi:hypothetical protein
MPYIMRPHRKRWNALLERQMEPGHDEREEEQSSRALPFLFPSFRPGRLFWTFAPGAREGIRPFGFFAIQSFHSSTSTTYLFLLLLTCLDRQFFFVMATTQTVRQGNTSTIIFWFFIFSCIFRFTVCSTIGAGRFRSTFYYWKRRDGFVELASGQSLDGHGAGC